MRGLKRRRVSKDSEVKGLPPLAHGGGAHHLAQSVAHRQQTPQTLLLLLLHPDVVPIVLGYASTIAFRVMGGWGTRGSEDGQFCFPSGLAWHGHEELLVCDEGNHRIQVFHHRTGRFLRQWGKQGSHFGNLSHPSCIQTHQDNVIVLDRDVHMNRRFRVFRGSDSSFLYDINGLNPSALGILVDATPRYYIVSRSPDSTIIDILSAEKDPSCPILERSLSIRKAGCLGSMVLQESELFVVDWLQNCVHQLDLVSGISMGQFGGTEPNILNGWLVRPTGLVVHGDQVMVASSYNNRLVIYDRLSRGYRSAWLGEEGPPAQIFKNISIFSDVRELLIHPSTNQLFVSDLGNHRIVVVE